MATCGELYSLYKIWYERNHPEDKLVSYRKFGSITASIVGQSKPIQVGHTVCKQYKSDLHTIENNLKLHHGCDVNTLDI
jgi:hypothetical protein